MTIRYFYILIILLLPNIAKAQLGSIDHWETVIYETDTWDYWLGFSAPPNNWNQPSFTPANWSSGQGGIGYADGDDNTVIPPVLSVFMRLDFNIVDTSKIFAAILNADYDDAFVAYINGQEVARANIGTVGIPPAHTDVSDTYREAVMYQGQNPETYFFDKSQMDTLLKQGTNTLAIQVHNFNSTSSDMSSRFFFSVGVSDAGMTYDTVPSWFVEPFISSNLPLLKIYTNGQSIMQEVKITADLKVIDNGVGNLNYLDDAPNGYNDKIGIEMRGASSLMYPKNGFGFETRDSLGNNNNVELLGLPEENDWVLHGPYSDKTLLRNFVTYHIGGQLGRYNPRVRLCEVFMDDQYWGVYMLVEKIKRDKNRVDIAKLNPTDTLGDELTGGYIFKIDRDMGSENGWLSNHGYGYYAYHHPNADGLHQKQKNYIQLFFANFENLMNSSNFNHPTLGYTSWIDVPSFIDYMLIQEITRNIDAYRLSAFMYKEKDSDGGKLHAGPIWDYNLGYGNEDFCDNGNYTSWAFNYNQVCGSPFPFWWGKLVNNSDFRDEFHCRWNELRSTVLHTDTILHFIDSMVLHIKDARIRDTKRWNTIGQYIWPNAYVGQTYEDEVLYLKDWITDRMNWLETNMIGSAANCTSPTETTNLSSSIKVYPNPFQDYLTIETDNQNEITIQFTDALGRIVEIVEMSPISSFQQLPTHQLAAGIYFYTVYENGKLMDNGKVIKRE